MQSNCAGVRTNKLALKCGNCKKVVNARLSADSWNAGHVARDERDDRAGTSQNRNSEYRRIVQRPAWRKCGCGRRIEINPFSGSGWHPKGNTDNAARRSALGRDGRVLDRGKCGCDNEIVAQKELAGSMIRIGFEWVREL